MNEENKTQDDGYQEIDVSKPQKEEPEKVEPPPLKTSIDELRILSARR